VKHWTWLYRKRVPAVSNMRQESMCRHGRGANPLNPIPSPPAASCRQSGAFAQVGHLIEIAVMRPRASENVLYFLEN
jgi:hypothetical protein